MLTIKQSQCPHGDWDDHQVLNTCSTPFSRLHWRTCRLCGLREELPLTPEQAELANKELEEVNRMYKALETRREIFPHRYEIDTLSLSNVMFHEPVVITVQGYRVHGGLFSRMKAAWLVLRGREIAPGVSIVGCSFAQKSAITQNGIVPR